MASPAPTRSWRESLAVYRDRRLATIFVFGMASGLPSSLVFATLSIWLRESGISRTAIGVLGVATTPYALHFLWAPLVDRLRPPVLGALGRRRGWILLCQATLVAVITGMGFGDPAAAPYALGVWALAVAFISATQDVAIDAYRVEILDPERYGAGAAMAVYGWYLGAFLSGAGVLYVASFHGWAAGYGFAAFCLALTMAATLAAAEPELPADAVAPAPTVAEWLRRAALAPFADFVRRFGWVAGLIVLVIVLYKLGDAMLGRMSSVFYVDLGFSKIEIANYSKTVGLAATLLGVLVGGIACARLGVMRALILGAVLMTATNLMFAVLATAGRDSALLAAAVFLDNLTGGMATSAFVAYLSGLCNVAFTATQYALLGALGNFARIQLGALSGWMVDAMGGNWALFFIVVTVGSLPGIALLVWMVRRFPVAAGRGGREQAG